MCVIIMSMLNQFISATKGSSMDSWMISLVIAICGVIAVFAVVRKTTDDNTKRLDGIGTKVDSHSEVLSEHKITLGSSVTMEQVDQKFLTINMFKQYEKHIDQRFGTLEKKLDQVETKLEDGFEDLKDIVRSSYK